MGIKYSDIDGIRNCEIHNGKLYLETVGSKSTREFDIPIDYDLITPPFPSSELSKRNVIAECAMGSKLFILYNDWKWNLLDVSRHLLLDFGELPNSTEYYTYILVGSILHKRSYRSIYVDRDNDLVYITENEKSACLKCFPARELATISFVDQAMCISKASDTPDVGYCGGLGLLYTIEFYTGEVKRC